MLTERITIERKIGDDGSVHDGAGFVTGDGTLIDLVTGLGLLEAAKINLIDRWVNE